MYNLFFFFFVVNTIVERIGFEPTFPYKENYKELFLIFRGLTTSSELQNS